MQPSHTVRLEPAQIPHCAEAHEERLAIGQNRDEIKNRLTGASREDETS